MKIFVAGGTGAIGRPLIAELLAKGHALVALTRSAEKAQALVEQCIEPAIADVAAVRRLTNSAPDAHSLYSIKYLHSTGRKTDMIREDLVVEHIVI